MSSVTRGGKESYTVERAKPGQIVRQVERETVWTINGHG